MKLLILANDDGGLYKFRKELLQRLLKEQNQVYIAVPNGPYISLMKRIGCRFVPIQLERRGKNPFNDLKLIFRYNEILRKLKPEVVLTYTIKPNIYGGILCRVHRIPYIENITGCGTAIENGGLLSKVLLFLYKISLKGASQVFFQNQENQNFFRKKMCLQKSRLIPGSGVNLQEHKYEEYPAEDEKIHFLFVGRIMKDKGIEELLSCAEVLADHYPKIYFDLIGDYEDKIYQSSVEELEKKEAVRYLGFQDNVHAFMKTHHAVIMPSYHEGMSNVLLEAAACGRPILATKVSGCRETYDDGESGIGFAARNREDLLRAIKEFLGLTYKEKQKMGIKGREKVEREFDRKQIVEIYLEEIRQAGRKNELI